MGAGRSNTRYPRAYKACGNLQYFRRRYFDAQNGRSGEAENAHREKAGAYNSAFGRARMVCSDFYLYDNFLYLVGGKIRVDGVRCRAVRKLNRFNGIFMFMGQPHNERRRKLADSVDGGGHISGVRYEIRSRVRQDVFPLYRCRRIRNSDNFMVCAS